MKKFFDYTDEKITEKVFVQGLVASVIGILICIISLCSMTYAWFIGGVSSGSNVLKSGSFDLDINAMDGTDTAINFNKSGGVWSGEFAPGTYEVTMKVTDTSTVKGYCTIISDGKTYNTEVMSRDTLDTYNETIKFVLKIEDTASVTIKFVPKWGIPAGNSDIVNGNTVTIGIGKVVTITGTGNNE